MYIIVCIRHFGEYTSPTHFLWQNVNWTFQDITNGVFVKSAILKIVNACRLDKRLRLHHEYIFAFNAILYDVNDTSIILKKQLCLSVFYTCSYF